MDKAGDMDGRERNEAAPGRLLSLLSPVPPALFAIVLLILMPDISDGREFSFGVTWVAALGISLRFYIDGLSFLFALLISGIGVFVAIYAAAYLRGHPDLRRFYFYLYLFMVGMLGLVLAGDLITLFVFWEVTTISSYLLIGFNNTSAVARRSALQALLVTTLGGLCLLVGLLLLGSVADSFELRQVLASSEAVHKSPLYLPILILILIGAFCKSAQLPFHFWLPNAMAAPTPVSAYLHSATMVKAGIYLLARMHPILAHTEWWEWILTCTGAATAAVAAVAALRQTDLKLALAYTTLIALGTITMFLGSDASAAVAAAITFLLVHSFYKAALFMVVGIIDKQAGTRNLNKLGGLGRCMPITVIAASAAALSMAGFPPFLGFIGKELKYEGALAVASEPALVATVAVFVNAVTVTVAGMVALKPFWRKKPQQLPKVKEAPVGLWISPLILSGLGLTFGLAPDLVGGGLVEPALSAVLGIPETIKLQLWHGINIPLLMSILTFILGVTMYLGLRRLRAWLAWDFKHAPTSADQMWDKSLELLKAFASAQTRILQNGVMRRYLSVIFTTISLALAFALIHSGQYPLDYNWPQLNLKEWAALLLTVGGAFMAGSARKPLIAICALGALGVGIALIYLFLGAPDVAITQLLVETLYLVLVAAILPRLPVFNPGRKVLFRPRDATLGAVLGLLITLSLLAVLQTPLVSPTSEFFVEAAVPEGHGRNIVNVILVDFRALDTFGEIIVVFTAAIAAVTLLGHQLRRGKQ
ncbi:hydrogen gas-evolving membrane-bound hydrogenase subunit E [uncultured Microbulbifer sp.]|uniref:hydrogen gas-evolving membrane-bound hydrogenase subunit E n=1 Tax=uncultured Microbulbifer sp. TaxID=348147 RepID=UPI00261EFD80|nr:hydrogen gas-evolving membrane-bound hydrogenase subunit E [uncultured Microbulbifer sp.]